MLNNSRGEWYVIAQGILFVIMALSPLVGAAHIDLPAQSVWMVLGLMLMIAGLIVSFAGILTLGRNLSPLPHPKDDAELIQSGIFAIVRHPIYTGIILAGLGWALYTANLLTLALAVVLFVFFDIKSRREERMLLQKFPDYAAYRQRVKKLIPFIY